MCENKRLFGLSSAPAFADMIGGISPAGLHVREQPTPLTAQKKIAG